MRRLPKSLFAVAEDAKLADLMRCAQNGDGDAYRVVLDHCRDAFVHLAEARRQTGRSEDEIVCQCLRTLHRARHTFDSRRSLSTLVLAVARHHGLRPDRVDAPATWTAWIASLLRGSRSRASEPNAGGRAVRTAEDENNRTIGISYEIAEAAGFVSRSDPTSSFVA